MEKKKLKVLVVTTQYIHNYGAVLQAIAFKNFLEQKFNLDVTFLNPQNHKNRIFEKIFPISINSIAAIINNLIKTIYIKKLFLKNRKFAMFIKDNFVEILDGNQEQFDLYITGGDQMFNRGCLTRSQNLLTFAGDHAKKISYSTSMGSASFTDCEWEYIKKALNKYTYLSLREQTAQRILSSKIDVPTRIDIDPTFLVDSDFWNNISKEVEELPNRYILVYELMSHKDLDRMILTLKKKLNIPVVKLSFSPKSHKYTDFVVLDAGPNEFLALFKKAEFVVTTSFHGTCFSIINKKPFVSLVQKNEKRITCLLEEMELSECCFSEVNKTTQIPQPNFKIAEKVIEKKNIEAVNYIKNQLI